MVRLLLDHGWDVNEKDADERTPLLLAAEAGYSSVVQVLLGHPQYIYSAVDYLLCCNAKYLITLVPGLAALQ
jgi:ankyrin repeat protein